MRHKLHVLFVPTAIVVIAGSAKLAMAVTNTPPDGYYPYKYREQMVASTSVTFTNQTLTSDGFAHGTVQSNANGTAVTITSYPYDLGYLPPIDYYMSLPNVLSSGAPDPNWVQFDLKDATGEFAGFKYSYTWVDSGVTWYYFYQEINTEGHWLRFSVDGAGNVDESTVMQAKGRERPDRCKIVSDWGALQCPRDPGAIREIPTQVSSFLARIGWFDTAVNWTSSHLQSATTEVAGWLGDPKVQLVLAVTAATAAAVACCIATSGSVCAWCVVADLAAEGLAMGGYYNAINGRPDTSSQLRAAGVIACAGSGCNAVETCGQENHVSNTCFIMCRLEADAAGCSSPWTWSSAVNQCTMFISCP